MKAIPLATLALSLTATAAIAGTPIDETRNVAADARIDVSNVKGEVTVSGWDKPEVSITGTLGEGAKGLSIEGGASHLVIKVEPPSKSGWFSWGSESRMGPTTLNLKVPRAAEMKIDVVSADVALSGVDGRALDVNGVSAKLRVDSGAKEIGVGSVSGDVELTGKSERAHVETVSGNIRARGLGGQIKFETVSGDVNADNARYREVSAGSVSGDVDLRGHPDADARVDVETMSGDVRLYLPSDVSSHLHASSFSGSIRSDFGSVKEEEHGPGSSLDTTVGSNGGRVKIETFSGDIEIRRD